LIIISALFGSALNLLTFFKGLSMTSPIQASLIIVTTPIIVTALSRFVLKDRLGAKGWLGLVLGFSGTAWLILNGNPMAGFKISLGDLLVFINSISYAIYLLISKPLLDRYHFVWLTKWMSLIGLFFTAWFGIPELLKVDYAALPVHVWGSISYVLLLTTVLSFIFFGYALTHTTTSVVSSYLYLQPLTATTFAIILGKDHLTVTKVISGLVILGGVYLVNIGKARPGNIE
jgi:drug/metabolite transporter (DMT)-like permease